MLNTSGTISYRTNGYFVRQLLETYQALTVTERFGQVDAIPKKNSKTIKFRRYRNFDTTVAPLAEGVPPVGKPVTYDDIEAVLEQFGDVAKITDVLADTHEDPILKRTAKLLGQQAVQVLEKSRIEHLNAGSNVFYGSGVAGRTSVVNAITRGDLRKIYRQFKRNNAMEITEIIKATALIATQPVGSAYFAMGHTDLDSDIRGLTGFIPVEQYSNASDRIPGEIGKCENFRIVLTTNFAPVLAGGGSSATMLANGIAPASSTACDVYRLIFVAKDAYGIVPLQGMDSVSVAIKNPGEPTKDDPCGQLGFASWITWNTTCILNESYMARLEVACTANPT